MTKTALVLSISLALSPAIAQTGTQPPPVPGPTGAPALTFSVVSIKPHDLNHPPYGWNLNPTDDGYDGQNISLYQLIREAYGDDAHMRDPQLISGGPSWIDTGKFDLKAKYDIGDVHAAESLTYRQKADLLRAVLADRFQLKIHFVTKEFPTYNLVIARGGPKLTETRPEDIKKDDSGQPVCWPRYGIDKDFMWKGIGCPPKSLEVYLRYQVGRPVFDKTGLTGKYDIKLNWRSDNTPENSPAAAYPLIFDALQQQLGLKLEPSTAPLDVLVIDSAQRPSAN